MKYLKFHCQTKFWQLDLRLVLVKCWTVWFLTDRYLEECIKLSVKLITKIWSYIDREVCKENINETGISSLISSVGSNSISWSLTHKEKADLNLLSSVSLIGSPLFKTSIHPVYKLLYGCLEKGAHPIVYLNNHFPWNENRFIIGHWYLLSFWGTTLGLSWLSSGSVLSDGRCDVEKLPLLCWPRAGSE